MFIARLCLPIFCTALSVGGRAQEVPPACQWQGSQQWLSSRPSPLDSVVLTAPNFVAKVCYSRPSARGRAVFESLAPFGKVWRTGANEPTTLRLSANATVGGVMLPAGRYVLMTVPRPQSWILLFFTADASEPAAMFQSLREVGQGVATVERLGAPIETLTMRATTAAAGAELLLEWELLRARIPVTPQP